MLSRLLFRRVTPFSQLFYKPTRLEYPISLADENSVRNKQLMDEVNGKYSSILSKVLDGLGRSPVRMTQKYSVNCIKLEN